MTGGRLRLPAPASLARHRPPAPALVIARSCARPALSGSALAARPCLLLIRALPVADPGLVLYDGGMQEKTYYPPATVTVILQPDNKTLTMPRPKTVLQLLNKLGLRVGAALVIRDGGLLTQDREVRTGDEITIRVVTSSG